MKKLSAILILLLNVPQVFAQALPKQNDLYIPTSPGLILGDKAPLSVEKPTTPRALGFNMLNLLDGGAVEVAPYWLADRSQKHIEDWLGKSFTALETFSLSIASYRENDVYGIAPGIRSKLFRVYLEKKEIRQVVEDIQALLGEDEIDEDAIQKKLDKFYHASEFSVDVAAAMLGTTKDYSFKQLGAAKYAAWLNISYSLPRQIPVTGTALVRYTKSLSGTGMVPDTTLLDVGLSINYINKKFSLTGEYVYRMDIENHFDNSRLAIACNYAISENLFIVGSFGKNFTEVNNIIAILGLNVGLSRQKVRLSEEQEE